jgi:uncharacterized membrane protein
MFSEILGWAGSIVVALALLAASIGVLPATSRMFRWLNIGGSVLIALNSAEHRAFASVFANVVVIASIGYIELTQASRNRRANRRA